MSPILFGYVRPEPTTWVVLSFFAVIGLFFVFHRFWSMRNLDILLVLAFIPGFMMVYEGRRTSNLEPNTVSSPSDHDAASENTSVARLVPTPQAPGDTSELGRESAEAPVDVESSAERSDGTPLASADGGDQLESNETASVDRATIPANALSAAKKARRSLLYWGFLTLLVCAVLLTARMLMDTAIVRRPLLEPNLNSGGMLFIGASLLLFLLFNVATSTLSDNLQQGRDLGPGYILISVLPSISTDRFEIGEAKQESSTSEVTPKVLRDLRLDMTARILAICANLALIFCIVGIGYWHFGSFNTGVGAATIYLLLPYTAFTTGRVDHVVPGALLLLALLMYRQPFIAGLFLGCAAGVTYYPFSLLPLWCSFYWPRGIRRFAAGFACALIALIVPMVLFYSANLGVHLGFMFGIKPVAMTDMDGVWGLGWHPFVRIPIIVLFALLSMSFVVWPAQKNLATLMSCSAALMAATQFWHGFGGGLYMAWFLPLAILTIFRPNLDYLVALEVVRPWKRKSKVVKPETVANTNIAA
jgi:hypothetical protein